MPLLVEKGLALGGEVYVVFCGPEPEPLLEGGDGLSSGPKLGRGRCSADSGEGCLEVGVCRAQRLCVRPDALLLGCAEGIVHIGMVVFRLGQCDPTL